MSYTAKETEWLNRYENRLVEKGLPQEDAISLRNDVTMELNDSPESCADDDLAWYMV